MRLFLFRIGTLGLLFAALAAAAVPKRNSRYCVPCARTASGRIRRSTSARRAFQRAQPCPATGTETGACPGYVIDHIVPLKRGGADSPDNMQWQSVDESKTKDRVE